MQHENYSHVNWDKIRVNRMRKETSKLKQIILKTESEYIEFVIHNHKRIKKVNKYDCEGSLRYIITM